MDAGELKAWIDTGRDLVLLDVLGRAEFAELRIPGAKNACIYDVTFLDQVFEHGIAKDADIVVYCSSARSLASADAVDRLTRAGFKCVTRFEGGREAWQEAGFPLEGTHASEAWQAAPPAPLADRAYTVDPARSGVDWVGRNLGGRHFGTLPVSAGTVTVENGAIVRASFDIDMRAIEVGDLEGEMAEVLIAHLQSEDFFATDRFPTASCEVVSLVPLAAATPGAPNHEATCKLTLRGVTHELTVPALVGSKDDGVALDAHFDIDRTRWGVNYGSGKLYERLGMHLVNDEISLAVRVVAV